MRAGPRRAPLSLMHGAQKRFWIGCEWGLIGTLAMTTVMLVAYFATPTAAPQPLPLAVTTGILARVFGIGNITTAVILLGIILQLLYGSIWGGLLAVSTENVTIGKAIVVALGLWAVMWIFYVPMAGLETFTVATRPVMWALTLVNHLIYGVIVGAGLHRLREPLPDES